MRYAPVDLGSAISQGGERRDRRETRTIEDWPIYPAARCEACSAITGTRTWMVVPPIGVD